MNKIRIKCPAKINLSLKVINKREDGFHNIESIMQTVSLFDYLDIKVCECEENTIVLSGNSKNIPYDRSNLVYKAAELFLNTLDIQNKKIEIFVEKNIPVSAGLGGGSADASGTLYGLNELFGKKLNSAELHDLCAKLGSDLNVCLEGGRLKSCGRGEIIQKLPFEKFNLSIIKPISLGISAKEAYTKFSLKNKTSKRNDFVNDLEWAVIDDYEELKFIKNKYPKAVMTGSGSAYYLIEDEFKEENGFVVINNLNAVDYGVKADQ